MMQNFARISDGIVVEVITLPEDLSPDAAFHPTIAATLSVCTTDVQQGWSFDGEAFLPPVDPPPINLLAYAADARWRKEVGGITIAGIPVATDDRSKLMITGARVAAMADSNWSTVWIGADGGSYPVDATAMIAISDAVQAHVNATFATFAAIKARIEGGKIKKVADVDAAFAA